MNTSCLESCSQQHAILFFSINGLFKELRGRPLKISFLNISKKVENFKNMLNKKCQESKDLSFNIKKKGLIPYFRDLIGVQNFYTHLYSFNYFVISYRRNSIPLDDGDLIISLSSHGLRNWGF